MVFKQIKFFLVLLIVPLLAKPFKEQHDVAFKLVQTMEDFFTLAARVSVPDSAAEIKKVQGLFYNLE